MRYRIQNLPQWLDEDDDALLRRAAERLSLAPSALRDVVVLRRSLDARKKGHARWLVSLEVSLDGAPTATPADVAPAPDPAPPPARVRAPATRPVILGAGPAGLFCAWGLLERGVPSMVVRRRFSGVTSSSRGVAFNSAQV